MYPHSKTGYRQFPGMVEFAAKGTAAYRGGAVMGGIPYVIWGTSLNSIASNGTITVISGTVSGTGMLVVDTDGTQLVMTGGSVKMLYTVAGGLVSITDGDLGDAYSNAYLDNTFYYENSNGRIFASSLGDASAIAALDFITSESFTDGVTRLYALNQLLYSFGTQTTEVYYTSGTGNTRLSRQVVLEHGILGRFAVDSIDDSIYLMDAARRLTRLQGGQRIPISVPGLGEELDGYSTVSDCTVSCYTINQENFIEITFPTEDKSWVVHERSGEAVKREDWNNSRSRAAGYLRAYGKLIAADHSSGQLFDFSAATFQDNATDVERALHSELVTSELLGVPSRPYLLNAIYLDYDSSSGFLTTDAGVILTTDTDEPLSDTNVALSVNVSISKDGRGNFFSTPRAVTVADNGTLRLPNWGKCQDTIIRVSTSSDTNASFVGLAVDLELLDN